MRGPTERLKRLLDGRKSFTLCFLVYETEGERAAIAARLADEIGAREIVRFTDREMRSNRAVVEKLRGSGSSTPVQVMDPDRWPEGIETLAYRLNLGRELLTERCQRPILIWARDAEVTMFAKKERRPVGVLQRDLRPAAPRARRNAESQQGRARTPARTPAEAVAATADHRTGACQDAPKREPGESR